MRFAKEFEVPNMSNNMKTPALLLLPEVEYVWYGALNPWDEEPSYSLVGKNTAQQGNYRKMGTACHSTTAYSCACCAVGCSSLWSLVHVLAASPEPDCFMDGIFLLNYDVDQ